MKNVTEQQITAAAEAIANARGMRRGAPPINHILKILPAKLAKEVLEDAREALEASAMFEPEAGKALELIQAERVRQVSAEGYTPEHDDTHRKGEIAAAAACYAMPRDVRPCEFSGNASQWIPIHWPWSRLDWRPTPFDRVRELVKAGALIVAEIERLQRLENAIVSQSAADDSRKQN